MKHPSPSLSGRIFAAVALTAAFYGLAIAAAVGLLAVAVIEFATNLPIALLCVFAAIAIMAAIWPRIDKFQPPGVRLDERDHPRLFTLIGEMAERLHQSVPAEVYLVSDGRAFVAERGGILGIGSRRVMGIGLPLLQALSEAQLRGVVAHEFGHCYGGDTKLGRWVRRTREDYSRYLSIKHGIIRLPLVWYAKLYLRMTDGIARQQEFAADAYAVEFTGRKNYAEGLRRGYGIAAAFDAYWQSEMAPVLAAGYRTQIAAGFARFLANPEIERKLETAVAEQRHQHQPVIGDGRPSLADRLSAIDGMGERDAAVATPAAIGLLDRLSEQESALLRFQFGPERSGKLRSIDWNDVGRQVFVPLWRKTTNEFEPIFRSVSIDSLPELARAPDALRQAIAAQAKKPVSDAELAAAVESLLGAALAQSLAALNWDTTALPGTDVEVRQDEAVVTPFLEVRRWIADSKAAEGWPSFCKETGIVEAPILWPEKATVEVSLDELSTKIELNKSKKPAAVKSNPTA